MTFQGRINDVVAAHLCATNLLSPVLLQRIDDHDSFLRDVTRHLTANDEDLHRTTETCLKNLEPLSFEGENDLGPDARLRHVLVPEIWERLRPGSRDVLRRISTTLAEYDPNPKRPSFWEQSRWWSAERTAHLQATATRLREEIDHVGALGSTALIEETRKALAESHVIEEWSPDQCVYEPGFTYRVVPAVAWRLVIREKVKRSP